MGHDEQPQEQKLDPSHSTISNHSGQSTVEYILILLLATATFTGLYRVFNERIRTNFSVLGELLTADLQTGKAFFDGWKNGD